MGPVARLLLGRALEWCIRTITVALHTFDLIREEEGDAFYFLCRERGAAWNHDDICPAFTPGNRRGVIHSDKGVAPPFARIGGTAAGMCAESPSLQGDHFVSMHPILQGSEMKNRNKDCIICIRFGILQR